MSEFEIRIPARKKQPATDKDSPVVKVSPDAYNALVEIYNESTISMKNIASLLIIEVRIMDMAPLRCTTRMEI